MEQTLVGMVWCKYNQDIFAGNIIQYFKCPLNILYIMLLILIYVIWIFSIRSSTGTWFSHIYLDQHIDVAHFILGCAVSVSSYKISFPVAKKIWRKYVPSIKCIQMLNSQSEHIYWYIFSKLCRYVHHVMGVCCIVFDIDGMLFEFDYEFLKYWRKKMYAIFNIKKNCLGNIEKCPFTYWLNGRWYL